MIKKRFMLMLLTIILMVVLSFHAAADVSVNYTKKDLDASYNPATATKINLNANGINTIGTGAHIDGNTVWITQAGTYLVQGTLANGQLIVNAGDNDDVHIVLNGVNLTSATTAAIYVINADKVILTLAPGTVNIISDSPASTNELEDAGDVNAAIFSKDDLTINGTGKLIVNANYRHGIVSKDDLKIISGIIEVNAIGDGIKGRDMIAIKDGQIVINAQQDGMQSNNDIDPSKGFICIENGLINITAELDGIQAETSLYIKNGSITITSGGGSKVSSNLPTWGWWGRGGGMSMTASSTDSPSAKGLKAGVSIVIDGGTITIDASDDAVHSNDHITINGGVISISSGDDAIHADSKLTINSGEITISSCYEGLESTSITINGGTIRIAGARDDGINAAGGVDRSAINGRIGQNRFMMAEGYGEITITGGYIFVNAEGDGIDSNGDITMTGGTVIVHGPTSNGNAALDYNRSFIIEGGLLVAAGSAGMAMAPDANSNQKSLVITFNTSFPAQEIVHIADSDDLEPIITFKSSKAFQSLVVSSELLQADKQYVVYRGGSHTGTEVDGLFIDGNYTPGIQIGTTKINTNQSQGWPGFWGPMQPRPMGRGF